jgi:hypothetical protein
MLAAGFNGAMDKDKKNMEMFGSDYQKVDFLKKSAMMNQTQAKNMMVGFSEYQMVDNLEMKSEQVNGGLMNNPNEAE